MKSAPIISDGGFWDTSKVALSLNAVGSLWSNNTSRRQHRPEWSSWLVHV